MKYFTKTLIYIFLGIVLLITIFPIIYAVFGSFMTSMEFAVGGTKLIPEVWQWQNYINAWQAANFARYAFNSVFLSFWAILGAIVISSIPGYVFARGDFPGKKIIMGVFLSTMFLTTGTVTLYPIFTIARAVNLNQSIWGIVMVYVMTINVTYVFLIMGYIKGLPKELDEAATMDGCGFFAVYWRIIMPLCKPILATIALLTFRFAWNDYVLPMVFTITNESHRPLIVGVLALRGGFGGAAAYDVMLAGTTISLIPVVALYIITNKQFVSGVTAGAIKF